MGSVRSLRRAPRERSVSSAAAVLVGPTVAYALIGLGAMVMVFPLLWLLNTSLRFPNEVLTYPPELFPRAVRLQNFPDAVAEMQWRTFVNSVVFTAAVVLGLLALCTTGGFALARLRLPGRDAIFLLILSAILIPPQITMIPTFVLVKQLGWFNTYAGLIVPVIAHTSFGTMVFRQFFLQMPNELQEAAVLDGCTYWAVFWRIFLPLSKPALAAFAVISFLGAWNAYLWPLIATRSSDMRVIPLAIALLSQEGSRTPQNVVFAAVLLATLPLLAAFVFAQQYFQTGLTRTGIK